MKQYKLNHILINQSNSLTSSYAASMFDMDMFSQIVHYEIRHQIFGYLYLL